MSKQFKFSVQKNISCNSEINGVIFCFIYIRVEKSRWKDIKTAYKGKAGLRANGKS